MQKLYITAIVLDLYDHFNHFYTIYASFRESSFKLTSINMVQYIPHELIAVIAVRLIISKKLFRL